MDQKVTFKILPWGLLALMIFLMWAQNKCNKEGINTVSRAELDSTKAYHRHFEDSLVKVYEAKITFKDSVIKHHEDKIDHMMFSQEHKDSAFGAILSRITIDRNKYRSRLEKKDTTGAIEACNDLNFQLIDAGATIADLKMVRDSIQAAYRDFVNADNDMIDDLLLEVASLNKIIKDKDAGIETWMTRAMVAETKLSREKKKKWVTAVIGIILGGILSPKK